MVGVAARNAARADQKVEHTCRACDLPSQARGIVRTAVKRTQLQGWRCEQGLQHRAVAVVDLMFVSRPASTYQFIAGRKHRDLDASFDAHMRRAGSGKNRHMPRIDQRAGLDDFRILSDIFTRPANIEACLGWTSDRDLLFRRRRLLFHHDRRHTLGNSGTGQETHRLSFAESRRAMRTGNQPVDDRKRTGVCIGDVIGMNAIAVHRTLIERWQRYGRGCSRCRDTSGASAQRNHLVLRHGCHHSKRNLQSGVEIEQAGPVANLVDVQHDTSRHKKPGHLRARASSSGERPNHVRPCSRTI